MTPQNYFNNVKVLRSYLWQQDINRLKLPVNKLLWQMTPATVNAYCMGELCRRRYCMGELCRRRSCMGELCRRRYCMGDLCRRRYCMGEHGRRRFMGELYRRRYLQTTPH